MTEQQQETQKWTKVILSGTQLMLLCRNKVLKTQTKHPLSFVLISIPPLWRSRQHWRGVSGEAFRECSQLSK
jgi:hypothetical protein